MTAAAPTFRLAADCPTCGAPLVLRTVKATGHKFVACSACKFSEAHDPRVDALVAQFDALLVWYESNLERIESKADAALEILVSRTTRNRASALH